MDGNQGESIARNVVVQVIAPAQFGGAETVVRQLIDALARDGVRVIVFALGVVNPQAHSWVRQLIESGIDVRCPTPSRLKEYRELALALSRPDVTAVHSHGYRADFAAFMARPRHVRWVSTAHGFTGGTVKMRIYEALDRWLLRRADHVFAVSSKLQVLLSKNAPKQQRIQVVRNVPAVRQPVDRCQARSTLSLGVGTIMVGWVGRFSYEKGVDRLPDLLASQRHKFTMVLVGDGPLREVTLSEIEKKQISCVWLGARSDIGALIAAFDLLVLPSRTEGMPMVVLEAMTAGVPVVAFSVGDVAEAVTAQTGWCVPPDDLTAFAEAIAHALDDSDQRKLRGIAAKEHLVRHFSLSAWINSHLDAYGLPRKAP